MFLQRLINLCHGDKVSPYETEEILFLSTVAGLIRKEPFLIHLFLPHHQHSAFVINKIRSGKSALAKCPTKNPLFDCNKVEASIRRIAIVHDTVDHSEQQTSEIGKNTPNESSIAEEQCVSHKANDNGKDWVFACDCDKDERLGLLDSILGYFCSPVSNILYGTQRDVIALFFCVGQRCNCSGLRRSSYFGVIALRNNPM